MGQQKEEEKGTRDTPILFSRPSQVTQEETPSILTAQKATVVSDRSDRINDQEHKTTGEQKERDLLEKNNPSATEKKERGNNHHD